MLGGKPVSVNIHLNDGAFTAMNRPGGLIDRAVSRAAGFVRDQAKLIITLEGRVDTGALRQDVRSERVQSFSGGVYYRVGSDLEYAKWQEKGVEGPIVPRHAKVLRFKPKGSSVFVFRPRASGFEGIHFMRRARDMLGPGNFR
jgi:hypothetical protein